MGNIDKRNRLVRRAHCGFRAFRPFTTWNVTITCQHGGLNNSQVI